MIAWRVCKSRRDPWDATGAERFGGRWNSPGRALLYTADTYAGALLEILAHTSEPREGPGPHHALRLVIPDTLAEEVTAAAVPGWDQRDPTPARALGDRWLEEKRTAALVVPALPCRPIGRVILINPAHPEAGAIVRGEPFPVPWDERLF